jgi:hypothetical protein
MIVDVQQSHPSTHLGYCNQAKPMCTLTTGLLPALPLMLHRQRFAGHTARVANSHVPRPTADPCLRWLPQPEAPVDVLPATCW